MDQAKKQKTFRQNNFYTMQDTGIGFLVALLAPYAISLLVLLVCQTIIAGGVDGTALSESIGYKIVTALISPVAFCIAFFAFNKVKKISIKAAKVDFKIGTKNMIMNMPFTWGCRQEVRVLFLNIWLQKKKWKRYFVNCICMKHRK